MDAGVKDSSESAIVAIGQMLGQLTYDPFSWYREMRENSPVRYDPAAGVWGVFGYDDIKRVLSEPKVFSSHFPVPPGSPEELLSKTMFNMDPPKHTQLRSIVSRAFTPKALSVWRERISGVVQDLLDRMPDEGEIEFVADFASLVPVAIIAEMMGVSTQYADRFIQWSDQFTSAPHGDSEEAVARWQKEKLRSEHELSEFFGAVIEEKRKSPGGDIISTIIQEEGAKLTTEELIPFCVHLLAAGNESTASLITNCLYSVLETEGLYGALRAKPELVANAVEETLRFRPSFHMTRRLALVDVELGGQTIRQGQVVLPMIGSANRDERVFNNADCFDIHRKPNPHVALGQGIHYCLGASLLHMEAEAAIRGLIGKYEAIEVSRSSEVEAIAGSAVYGLRRLPLRVRAV